MSLRYLEPTVLIPVVKSAFKIELLSTTALAILGAFILFGLFGLGGDSSFMSLFGDFSAIVLSSLWFMLGLVALAHQLNINIANEKTLPNALEAFVFAWQRLKAILLLPLWGAGILLSILIVEIILLSLANIPALGVVWLALIAVPLLIFNTLVAVMLMLSIFNIAAYVAVSEASTSTMRHELWQLIKSKFGELVVYNLGGLLLTLVMATLLLSPLWLGAQATLALTDYAATTPWQSLVEATGFWGSIAHFVALIMGGLLLAAIGSVPIVIITHLTLLVHLELDDDATETLMDKESVSEGH